MSTESIDLKKMSLHDYVDGLHFRISQLETALKNVQRNIGLALDWIPSDIEKGE